MLADRTADGDGGVNEAPGPSGKPKRRRGLVTFFALSRRSPVTKLSWPLLVPIARTRTSKSQAVPAQKLSRRGSNVDFYSPLDSLIVWNPSPGVYCGLSWELPSRNFHLRVIAVLPSREREGSVFTIPLVLLYRLASRVFLGTSHGLRTIQPMVISFDDGCICPAWHCQLKTAGWLVQTPRVLAISR